MRVKAPLAALGASAALTRPGDHPVDALINAARRISLAGAGASRVSDGLYLCALLRRTHLLLHEVVNIPDLSVIRVARDRLSRHRRRS